MKLYNTMSGKEETFSQKKGPVRMYVCGITPYAACHLGHAMSAITFDVLRRYLQFSGFEVLHVQNFTDIDDKIINQALKNKTGYRDIVEPLINEYLYDMDRLNIKRAHIYPLASTAIPKMIQVIKKLIDKECAYYSNGDVYFRVTSYKDYGTLSRRSLSNMLAGARVKISADKDHPMDFALWKAAKPGEPFWESPWGLGRPGWHIECTALCLSHLGEKIDIHGGGQDLVFPHHENEIAQSEAFTGKKPFSRFWIHNGLLNLGANKMSKSIGSFIRVSKAIDKFGADELRLYFLSSHYRSPLSYSEELIIPMKRAIERLRNSLRIESPKNGQELDVSKFEDRFIEAMNEDLNTPQAVASLFDLVHAINRAREEGKAIKKAQSKLRILGEVLGFTFKETHDEMAPSIESLNQFSAEISTLLKSGGHLQLSCWFDSNTSTDDHNKIIDDLLIVRSELRQLKSYQIADKIRTKLGEMGISLEDTPDKTGWRFSA